jgi:hypothetical protein
VQGTGSEPRTELRAAHLQVSLEFSWSWGTKQEEQLVGAQAGRTSHPGRTHKRHGQEMGKGHNRPMLSRYRHIQQHVHTAHCHPSPRGCKARLKTAGRG